MAKKYANVKTVKEIKYVCSDGSEFPDETTANIHEHLLLTKDIRITDMTNYRPFDEESNMVDFLWFRLENEEDYFKLVEYYNFMYDPDCVDLEKPKKFPYAYYCVKEGDTRCCNLGIEEIKSKAQRFFNGIGIEISFSK